jgi:hypothetical protein
MPKPPKYPPPTILVDTREKQPFTFSWAVSHKQIAPVQTGKVDAGDYTILNIPNLITVERKKSVGELYNNLIGKEKYERFMREMERMQSFEYKYIVVEQNMSALWDKREFKFARKTKNYAGLMLHTYLQNIEHKYNVHVHFAGDVAEQHTLKLLVKAYEKKMKEMS